MSKHSNKKTKTRMPAVAGIFYPGDEAMLKNAVNDYLKQAVKTEKKPPKALIVPHAGYVYSGLTAAYAYKHLEEYTDQYGKVIIIGPAHRVYVDTVGLCEAAFFNTPLGNMPVDADLTRHLIKTYGLQYMESAHSMEHSLEVQIPFVQVLMPHVSILPLVVGDCRTDYLTQIIESVWGGPETLFLISTDLSHFHSYETAKTIDARTCENILNYNGAGLKPDDACGYKGVRAFLAAARHKNLDVKKLDLRNSGDTAGSKQSVVGYAAFGFWSKN